jgi:predicted acetyltransferase
MAKPPTARPTAPRIELVEVAEADRSVLENLAQLYQYDFSEFDGGDTDSAGRFGFVDFDRLFARPVHRAYLIRVGGQLAGFATAYRGEAFRDPNVQLWWMDEFFVMRRYRRAGVGEHVAGQIFDRLGGTWEVGQIAANEGARAFWRRVIGRYTSGDFEEFELDDDRWCGTVQYFNAGLAEGGGDDHAEGAAGGDY